MENPVKPKEGESSLTSKNVNEIELPKISNNTEKNSSNSKKILESLEEISKKISKSGLSGVSTSSISSFSKTPSSSFDRLKESKFSGEDDLNFSRDFSKHFSGKFTDFFDDMTTFFGFNFGKYAVDGIKKLFTGKGFLGGILAKPFNMFKSKEKKDIEKSEDLGKESTNLGSDLYDNLSKQQNSSGLELIKLMQDRVNMEKRLQDVTMERAKIKIANLKDELSFLQKESSISSARGNTNLSNLIDAKSIEVSEKLQNLIDSLTGMQNSSNFEDFESFAPSSEDLNLKKFKTGTKGVLGELFGDFGVGTLVMLHGKEAVVPENSIEGQFLKDFESGNFENFKNIDKVSPQESSDKGSVENKTLPKKSKMEIIFPSFKKSEKSEEKISDEISENQIGGSLDILKSLDEILKSISEGFLKIKSELSPISNLNDIEFNTRKIPDIEKSFREDSDRNEQMAEANASRERLLSKSDSDSDDSFSSKIEKLSNKNSKSIWKSIKSLLPSFAFLKKALIGLSVGLAGLALLYKFVWPLVKDQVEKIIQKIRDAFSPLTAIMLKKMGEVFSNFKKISIDKFKNLFVLLKESLKAKFPKTFDFFEKVGKFFKDLSTKFKSFKSGNFGKALGKIFKTVFNGIKIIGKLLLPLVELIPGVGMIKNIFGLFKNLFKILKFIAPFVKKLFLPLTIFMAVWDTIQGAMEGFEEEGIVGAIKGGLTGLFDSLIGGLLDLVKDGVSWILSKFGFSSASKFLDSFSFKDLYKEFLDLMFSIPGKLYDIILSALKKIPILGDKIKASESESKIADMDKKLGSHKKFQQKLSTLPENLRKEFQTDDFVEEFSFSSFQNEKRITKTGITKMREAISKGEVIEKDGQLYEKSDFLKRNSTNNFEIANKNLEEASRNIKNASVVSKESTNNFKDAVVNIDDTGKTIKNSTKEMKDKSDLSGALDTGLETITSMMKSMGVKKEDIDKFTEGFKGGISDFKKNGIFGNFGIGDNKKINESVSLSEKSLTLKEENVSEKIKINKLTPQILSQNIQGPRIKGLENIIKEQKPVNNNNSNLVNNTNNSNVNAPKNTTTIITNVDATGNKWWMHSF